MAFNGMGNRRRSRRIRIVLDSNMLLAVAEGINVFDRIEEKLLTKPDYIVIQPVLDELEKLTRSQSPKTAKKARLALEIAEKYCVFDKYNYDKKKDVDDLIIEYAEKNSVVVATNDRELKKKLRKKGIPQIYLREHGLIETDLGEYIII